MAGKNDSSAEDGRLQSGLSIYMFIQVLIAIFLSVNLLQLATFFSKEHFMSSMRYILFANMLLSDSWFLVLSDVLLVLYQFDVAMHLWLCILLNIFLAVSIVATPCTLTAMTLERYVAVCMPLRHAQLCSGRRALRSLALIEGLSCVPCVLFYLGIFSTVGVDYYRRDLKCSITNLEAYLWQNLLRSAIYALYFLAMCGVIVFCYARIMRAAKAAKARERETSAKGLSTVGLHAFQLLLCLVQLLIPPAEKALARLDYTLFRNVRFFNFILFILAPRCLSPLIYGLRDNLFLVALKHYLLRPWSHKP